MKIIAWLMGIGPIVLGTVVGILLTIAWCVPPKKEKIDKIIIEIKREDDDEEE